LRDAINTERKAFQRSSVGLTNEISTKRATLIKPCLTTKIAELTFQHAKSRWFFHLFDAIFALLKEHLDEKKKNEKD
jgi:hypothetical protein